MKTLTITDLKREQGKSAKLLSSEEMQRFKGGRKIAVLVDGRPGGVIDDFQLNMEIFKGNIGVKVV